MQVAIAVVLLAALNSVLTNDCIHIHPCPVVAFSTAYQAMMNLAYSNNKADKLTITGEEAAKIVSRNLNATLSKHNEANAAEIANYEKTFVAAKVEVWTLEEYFGIVGDSLGGALYECGIVDCGNVVSQAVKMAKYVQKHVTDTDTFEGYLDSTAPGRVDFFDNEVRGQGKCTDFQKYSDTIISYFTKSINEFSDSQ